MNKTVKTILQIASYIISALLGAYGGTAMMWFFTMENTRFKISQYASAVLLIVSSIALVAYQVVMIDDVSNGLLVYVAQAFLLVASIFGLDYYVKLITRKINGKHQAQ